MDAGARLRTLDRPMGARVVPPNQTELIVAALKKSGVPVGYFLFDGEQHGFRKAKNIKRALDLFHEDYSLPLAEAITTSLI